MFPLISLSCIFPVKFHKKKKFPSTIVDERNSRKLLDSLGIIYRKRIDKARGAIRFEKFNLGKLRGNFRIRGNVCYNDNRWPRGSKKWGRGRRDKLLTGDGGVKLSRRNKRGRNRKGPGPDFRDDSVKKKERGEGGK